MSWLAHDCRHLQVVLTSKDSIQRAAQPGARQLLRARFQSRGPAAPGNRHPHGPGKYLAPGDAHHGQLGDLSGRPGAGRRPHSGCFRTTHPVECAVRRTQLGPHHNDVRISFVAGGSAVGKLCANAAHRSNRSGIDAALGIDPANPGRFTGNAKLHRICMECRIVVRSGVWQFLTIGRKRDHFVVLCPQPSGRKVKPKELSSCGTGTLAGAWLLKNDSSAQAGVPVLH